MAQFEEITIDQGADVVVELELVDVNGSKKNLANHTLAGKIKKSYSDSSGEATAFTTAVEPPAAEGKATLSLTNTQTDALKAGRYVYDIELSYTDSAANTIIERILEGQITVTPSVTK